MKKALVLVLAVVLMMSMAVPAYAAVSPTAPGTNQNTTSPLPELDFSDCPHIFLIPLEKVKELALEAQKLFAEAQKTLAEALPKGMVIRYFFYCLVEHTGNEECVPATLTFKVKNVQELVVKEFIDDKWEELESSINENDTITVKGVVEGPIAIFTK